LRISGLLLGGGRASRFGGRKLDATIGGRRLVDIACEHFLDAGLAPVVFVGDVRPSVEGATVAALPGPTASMIETLRLGLDLLPDGPFCFAPADLPFLLPDLVRRLAETFARSGADYLVPTHRGRKGHPAFARSPDPFRILGDRDGPREILRAAGDRTLLVEVETPDILYDIDAPEDLARAGDAESRRLRLIERGDLIG